MTIHVLPSDCVSSHAVSLNLFKILTHLLEPPPAFITSVSKTWTGMLHRSFVQNSIVAFHLVPFVRFSVFFDFAIVVISLHKVGSVDFMNWSKFIVR